MTIKQELAEAKAKIALLEAGKVTHENVSVGVYKAPNGREVQTINFQGGRFGWKGLSMGKVKAQAVLDNIAAFQKFVKDGKLS